MSWEPVADAPEPCPGCGEVTWEWQGNRVRCGGCRFEVAWKIQGPAGTTDREPVDPEEAAEHDAWFARTSRELTLSELAESLVYAVAEVGDHPRFEGHGYGSTRLSQGDRLRITTAVEPGPAPPQQALRESLPMPVGELPDRSPAGTAVFWEIDERETNARIDAAERFTHTIEVGPRRVLFDGLRSDDSWALIGMVDDVRVTIAGQDTPLPHRLRRVNPARELR